MSKGTRAFRPPRLSSLHLLPGIFQSREAVDPGAVAVESGGRAVTYGELDRGADRIARRLQDLDIGSGDLVAVILPRSAEAYASILGVMKAGAVYLPLDPGTPPDQVRWILEDFEAAAVVAAGGTAALPAGLRVPVLRPGEVIADDCEDMDSGNDRDEEA